MKTTPPQKKRSKKITHKRQTIQDKTQDIYKKTKTKKTTKKHEAKHTYIITRTTNNNTNTQQQQRSTKTQQQATHTYTQRKSCPPKENKHSNNKASTKE